VKDEVAALFPALITLILFAILVAIWLIPRMQVRSAIRYNRIEPSRSVEVENECRRTLVQAFGASVVILGLGFTWQQIENERASQAREERQREFSAETARAEAELAKRKLEEELEAARAQREDSIAQFNQQMEATRSQLGLQRRSAEAQIEALRITQTIEQRRLQTERFASALASLSSDDERMRIGAVFSLEGISSEVEEYYWPVLSILVAFLRDHASADGAVGTGEGIDGRVRADIQAALTVLGRRKSSEDESHYDIQLLFDLGGLDLRRADLRNANMRSWNIGRSDLSRALLNGADLTGVVADDVRLKGAVLEDATLDLGRFIGADFREARLKNAELLIGDFEQADFRGAHLAYIRFGQPFLIGANFQDTSLRDVDFSEATMHLANLSGAHIDASTRLSASQLTSACADRPISGLADQQPLPCAGRELPELSRE